MGRTVCRGAASTDLSGVPRRGGRIDGCLELFPFWGSPGLVLGKLYSKLCRIYVLVESGDLQQKLVIAISVENDCLAKLRKLINFYA